MRVARPYADPDASGNCTRGSALRSKDKKTHETQNRRRSTRSTNNIAWAVGELPPGIKFNSSLSKGDEKNEFNLVFLAFAPQLCLSSIRAKFAGLKPREEKNACTKRKQRRNHRSSINWQLF